MSDHLETPDPVEYLDQVVDYLGFIQSELRGLQGVSTLVYELIQNADDVRDDEGNPAAFRMTFDVCDDALIVENDGVFRGADFDRMRQIAIGDKRNESGTTGAFGIGFISVYQITDYPEIFSSGKHWRIRPDNPVGKKIEQRRAVVTGTRFHLPWAFEASEVRKQLRIQTVDPENIESFTEEVVDSVRMAALFIKQLTTLEVRRSGDLILHIDRQIEENRLLLSENGKTIEWQIYTGSFEEEAKSLRKKFSFQIEHKRESHVWIAIPNQILEQGTLYAFLPTEERLPLPFYINADFFPSPDRKHIIFGEDYQSDWNRAAIKAAAQAFIDNFDQICSLLTPVDLWKAIAKVQECHRTASIDPVFQEFWDYLKPILPEKHIVLTSTKQKTRPGLARLLDKDEELAATRIFEGLGLQIVHPNLRPFYSLLMELGTPRLKIQDVVDALHNKGLGSHKAIDQLPEILKTQEIWVILWKALNVIWEARTPQADRRVLVDELSKTAIVFDLDNELWRPVDLFRADQAARQIFSRLRWFHDLDPEGGYIPRQLVPLFTPVQAVDHLERIPAATLEKDWQKGRLDLERLYAWFETHRSEISGNPVLVERLRSLPIWPVKGNLKPLANLYLAGGFDDPLNLAELVDIKALGSRSDFLHHDLRVKILDFPTYVCDWVKEIVENPDEFSVEARRSLIQLLALRLGEIRNNVKIHSMLKRLPLVECVDGVFYPAGQVYFESDIITILGKHTKLASLSQENYASVEALYKWLGVSRDPRNQDVLERIKQLVRQLPTPESRSAIEKVFRYLANRWNQWSDDQKNIFQELKRLRWLPGTQKTNEWHSPDTLHSIFRDYLFKSQGNFLGFARTIQEEASDLIKFLGISAEPLPIYVVRHLLTCDESDERSIVEIYRFLNTHSNDPALDELMGKTCILVKDETHGFLVRPDQVYWHEHPFGPFRYRLSQDFLRFSKLLERLKVKQYPDDQDYIQVLLDISEHYGSENMLLDEDAYVVMMNCWKTLTDAYEEERITREELTQKLAKRKVIPDPRNLLALPENIFFEDRAGMAVRFQELLKNNVIQRTEGAWFAMDLVGVQPLSRAVSVDLAVCEDAVVDNLLAQRVNNRRILIRRVVEAEKTASGEPLDGSALDRLDFHKVSDLEIAYTIRAFKRTYTIEPEPANAILKDNTIYAVHRNVSPNWAAVSRELATAIKPVGEIGSMAGGIKDVLSNPTLESASASLDELGYPPLQSGNFGPVSTGATEMYGPEGEERLEGDPLMDILGGQPGRTPMSPQPYEGPGGGKTRTPKKRRKSSRLVSYVYPEDAQSITPGDSDRRTRLKKIEKVGIQKVIADESLYHRTARDMNEEQPNHQGYDLESDDQQGNLRYIEVKALSGVWDAQSPAQMTKNEFEEARRLGDQFWLYIVEYAGSEDAQIYRIQNPAHRAGYYLFDHGWEPLSEYDKDGLL